MGVSLQHGTNDHEWQLRDPHTGRVTVTWTNPAPAHQTADGATTAIADTPRVNRSPEQLSLS